MSKNAKAPELWQIEKPKRKMRDDAFSGPIII
jgi:hypothetical protein